jgi:hypothetical protein
VISVGKELDGLGGAWEFGLSFEDGGVEDCLYAGEGFSQADFCCGDASGVLGGVAGGVDAGGTGEVDSAFAVEGLRDDDDARLAENVAGAEDGIERAEAGVIESDGGSGNTSGEEGVAHRGGFVVGGGVVVATEEEVFDAA